MRGDKIETRDSRASMNIECRGLRSHGQARDVARQKEVVETEPLSQMLCL